MPQDIENSDYFESLRFGSSIPGGYWGCCAGDIFQCFKTDPEALASIQFVGGDECNPITDMDGNFLYAGPTNKDVFLARLRQGTFGCGDMPNHFFLCVLTEDQIQTHTGLKWLAILKEHGFEFIRTVANSVYTYGPINGPQKGNGRSLNYVFGLFRGIQDGAPEDAFTPPEEWRNLSDNGKTELWQLIGNEQLAGEFDGPTLTAQYAEADLAVWQRVGPAKLLTEAQIREAGAPVVMAAYRTNIPQETKEKRDARLGVKKKETSLRAEPASGSNSVAM